jgi:hypothetical protein
MLCGGISFHIGNSSVDLMYWFRRALTVGVGDDDACVFATVVGGGTHERKES